MLHFLYEFLTQTCVCLTTFWYVGVAAQSPTWASNSVSLGDATCVVRIDLITPFTQGPSSDIHRVSGTNAGFSFTTPSIVHDGATLTVTDSQVEMGGETLSTPMGSGAILRYATTHFADQTSLVVKWRAKFHYEDPTHSFSGSTDWVQAEFTVKVYNKAGVYEISQFALLGTGSQAAEFCYIAADHGIQMHRGGGWDVNVIGNEQPYQTAAHIGTHGNASGQLQYDTSPATWFDGSTVAGWRSYAASHNVPPVNVAFFDSCETGSSSTPLSMLNPTDDLGDRTTVAFTVLVDARASQEGCNVFYDKLQLGMTVKQALTEYVTEYNSVSPKAANCPDLVLGTNPTAKIFGDKFTRIIKVYTGNDFLPGGTTWYRKVNL